MLVAVKAIFANMLGIAWIAIITAASTLFQVVFGVILDDLVTNIL